MAIEDELRAELRGLAEEARGREEASRPAAEAPADGNRPPTGIRSGAWPEVRSNPRHPALATGDWLPSDAPESRHRLQALTHVRRAEEVGREPTAFRTEEPSPPRRPRIAPETGPVWRAPSPVGPTLVLAIIWQLVGGLVMTFAAAALFSARTDAQRFGLLGLVIAGGAVLVAASVASLGIRLRSGDRDKPS